MGRSFLADGGPPPTVPKYQARLLARLKASRRPLERVILHRRVVKDLERLGRRPEPRGLQPAGETAGPVLAIHAVGGALHRLDKRPIRALLGGLLVDGQLGQRKRLEPLVGDRSALRTERP